MRRQLSASFSQQHLKQCSLSVVSVFEIEKQENLVRKQKRDLEHRSYVKGYQAANQGRSLSTCPYQDNSVMSFHWSRGWREGRGDYWAGFNQQAFQQKAINL